MKRRHIGHLAFWVGIRPEGRAGEFRKDAERKRTGTIEKTGICHAQLVDPGALLSAGLAGPSVIDGRLLSIRRRTSPVMSSF